MLSHNKDLLQRHDQQSIRPKGEGGGMISVTDKESAAEKSKMKQRPTVYSKYVVENLKTLGIPCQAPYLEHCTPDTDLHRHYYSPRTHLIFADSNRGVVFFLIQ